MKKIRALRRRPTRIYRVKGWKTRDEIARDEPHPEIEEMVRDAKLRGMDFSGLLQIPWNFGPERGIGCDTYLNGNFFSRWRAV